MAWRSEWRRFFLLIFYFPDYIIRGRVVQRRVLIAFTCLSRRHCLSCLRAGVAPFPAAAFAFLRYTQLLYISAFSMRVLR